MTLYIALAPADCQPGSPPPVRQGRETVCAGRSAISRYDAKIALAKVHAAQKLGIERATRTLTARAAKFTRIRRRVGKVLGDSPLST